MASFAVRLSIIRVNGVKTSPVPSAYIRVCRNVNHRMVAFVSSVKKLRAVRWNALTASINFLSWLYRGDAAVNQENIRFAKVQRRLMNSM